MKTQFTIARRELFKKLAGAAGAMGLAALMPSAEAAESEPPATSSGSATVRVILSTGTNVQWMAVTSGGLTAGGQTTINGGSKGFARTPPSGFVALDEVGCP